ncbi:MAG: hypothetical protein FOGNACKC_05200 [Anaerolineae bacterium]|nr:hypothetical protein [Anaerolineae bacterium]
MRKNAAVYAGLSVVFATAAILNYNALQHFAFDKAGVNFWLSFGVPVLIDVFIAIAAYIALINREQGESTTLAKSIVVTFTLGSIYLNSLHYPLTVYGLSMAALVPAVVFLSIELALQQMEIKHRRDETILNIRKLQGQAQEWQTVLARIEAEKVQLLAERDAVITRKNAEFEQKTQLLNDLLAQIQTTELHLEQVKTALVESESCTVDWQGKEANLLRLDGMLAAGLNYSQAAKVLNIAPNTARNWAKNLNGNSLSKGEVKQ